MTITGIERQKRRPHRVNISIDGEFAFGIHEDLVLKHGLRKNDTIDELLVLQLKKEEEYTLARQKALSLIARRLRTEKELRSRLLRDEFTPTIVAEVLVGLSKDHLVDDRAFALAFINDAMKWKPAGATYFLRALKSKGIDSDLAREVIEERFGEVNEEHVAATFARRMLERYKTSRTSIPREKQERRIMDRLARRGFGSATIFKVVREIFASDPKSSG